MKKLMFLLLLGSTVSCANNQPKEAQPPFKHVGHVVYINSLPPEKFVWDFDTVAEAEAYYGEVNRKFKNRSAAKDAEAAVANNDYYILANTDPGSDPLKAPIYTQVDFDLPSLTLEDGRKAYVNCFIKRLEGSNILSFTSSVLKADPVRVENWKKYSTLGGRYAAEWNKVMMPACAKREGNFPKPPPLNPPL